MSSKVFVFLPFLSVVPVFQRTHSHVSLEIFSEERYVGKVQGVGNVLNGKL